MAGYDAVVIGSGLAGLSAAAFLGRAGRRALVVERREEFGGYAAAFARGRYTFDPAIHVLGQGEGLLLSRILHYLGVADRVELIGTGSLYEARYPGLTVRAPSGREPYLEAHARRFPSEAGGLRRFLDVAEQVHREVHTLPPHLSLRELEAAVARFPTLFKYRTATLGDVLDEHLTDERLKALVSSYWPHFGLPPSKLSFFTVATPLTTFINEGPYRCAGGTQRLVDALVAAVRLAGGELLAGNGVRRVAIESGRASGVVLDDGTFIDAPVVVAAADAKHTLEQLVGLEHLPSGYVKRFQRLRPSLSAVVVFAATSLDVRAAGLSHTTFVNDDWSPDRVHQAVLEGRPGGHWLALPSLFDDTVAPPDEHLVIVTSLATADAVSEPGRREAFVQELLAPYEQLLPGLRASLTFLESATPRTLERSTGNHRGALYGWEQTPDQAGTRRLAHRTPVDGLFLCGHWTQPGAGAFRVIFSGVETTMNVLGAGYADEFLAEL